MSRFILIPAVCLLCLVARAQIYCVSEDGDNLYTVCPPSIGNCSTTPLVDSNGQGIVQTHGLAFDWSADVLYLIADIGASHELATVDPATGVVTRICPLTFDVETIMCDPAGNMYAIAEAPDRFFSVDKATGTMTLIAPLSLNGGNCLGIAKNGDILRVSGPQGMVSLEILDTATGAATLIGYTGAPCGSTTGLTASVAGGFVLVDDCDYMHYVAEDGHPSYFYGPLNHTPAGIVDAGLFGPPCSGLYPGSGDDMKLSIDVGTVTDCSQVALTTGQYFSIRIVSPLGSLLNETSVVTAQVFATGGTPPHFPLLPGAGLWFDPFANPGPVALFEGDIYDFLIYDFLIFLVQPVPPGLSVMINAFALSPLTNNGIYGVTEGIELQL